MFKVYILLTYCSICMSIDQSGSLYMYELLPIWIVVFVFLKARLISLLRISLYVRDFSKTCFTPLLAGHVSSLRDLHTICWHVSSLRDLHIICWHVSSLRDLYIIHWHVSSLRDLPIIYWHVSFVYILTILLLTRVACNDLPYFARLS